MISLRGKLVRLMDNCLYFIAFSNSCTLGKGYFRGWFRSTDLAVMKSKHSKAIMFPTPCVSVFKLLKLRY